MKQAAADTVFNEIYDLTYRKTAAWLTAHCRRLSDVEDILQETYLSVYRTIASQGRSAIVNPQAYVISAAKARLIDSCRKSNSAPMLSDAEEDVILNIADSAPSPDEQFEDLETLTEVQAFMKDFSEDIQREFYLHCCFGMSYSEIAMTVGKNESTIRSDVSRLRLKIRDALERRT